MYPGLTSYLVFLSALIWKRSLQSSQAGNKRQKWTPDPYLRQFDTFHRQNLAICPDLSAESMGFLPSLKIGEFLSQSVFRAKLFVRKISIGSSI